MRKLLLVMMAFIVTQSSYSQADQDVVAAERAFARYAITHSMRQAFLQYLDSQGVVFARRGAIRNGIEQWTATPESSMKLLWQPAFAAMAASGDMGFTTGPYELRQTMEDTALDAGQYTTIWVKNKAGEWKFLVDLGTHYKQSLYDKQSLQQAPAFTSAPVEETSILLTEKKFVIDYAARGTMAFREVIMPGSWFNMDREHPHHTLPAIEQALLKVPADLVFTPVASGMARSRDLAYVYGMVTNKERTDNYLRIWAHTSTGWKLLVQVLKW
ncbi:DUF4440 domain-containing protein [Paraflavitalea soli]|nr:DUF4440 domain-containing protein [Paraflavitalea soli]